MNMVNNIAANVLGGKPELEDGVEIEGTDLISVLWLDIEISIAQSLFSSPAQHSSTYLLLFAWQLFVTSERLSLCQQH